MIESLNAIRGRFLWVLSGAACAALPTAPGTVSGVVRDTVGAPIHHAQVWIAGTGIRAYADSFGRYQLDSVPAGRVQLRATLVGYGTEEHRSVLITSAQWTKVDFVLRLPRPCELDCADRDSAGPGKQ
jgi:hypothetical protein